MEHPKDIGDRSTLAIIIALKEAGYGVLMPFGENTRYDLVIESEGGFHRVQCKTGRLLRGVVFFRTASSYYHHPKPRVNARSYRGEIDFFGVYCGETGGVYLVPIEDVSDSAASLRVEATRNNQSQRVRYAHDYEIGRVAITRELRAPSGA